MASGGGSSAYATPATAAGQPTTKPKESHYAHLGVQKEYTWDMGSRKSKGSPGSSKSLQKQKDGNRHYVDAHGANGLTQNDYASVVVEDYDVPMQVCIVFLSAMSALLL